MKLCEQFFTCQWGRGCRLDRFDHHVVLDITELVKPKVKKGKFFGNKQLAEHSFLILIVESFSPSCLLMFRAQLRLLYWQQYSKNP